MYIAFHHICVDTKPKNKKNGKPQHVLRRTALEIESPDSSPMKMICPECKREVLKGNPITVIKIKK